MLPIYRQSGPGSSSSQALFSHQFQNLPIEVRTKVIDQVVDTGTIWQTEETLHISGVLFQEEGSLRDTIAVALATHLGYIKKVKVTPYLFSVQDQPCWGVARRITCLAPKTYHTLRSLIPRKIPIEFEEEDKEIIQESKAGKDWYTPFEKKYNLPLTYSPCDEDGWPLF